MQRRRFFSHARIGKMMLRTHIAMVTACVLLLHEIRGAGVKKHVITSNERLSIFRGQSTLRNRN